MGLLTKDQINHCLNVYYEEHHGRKDTDIWYPQPAVNVWLFERDNQIVMLKCHILTGEVTETIEHR